MIDHTDGGRRRPSGHPASSGGVYPPCPAEVVRELGEAWTTSEPGTVPPGPEEQVHHAFHLRVHGTPPERWQWEERSGGEVVEHRSALRWVSLEEAAAVLWPQQAMWMSALRASLLHPC